MGIAREDRPRTRDLRLAAAANGTALPPLTCQNVVDMSSYRAPRARSLLEAAYSGLPDADPNVSMTAAVGLIRAALYDLRRTGDPKYRLGATEMDLAQALATKRRPVLLQSDFQAAYDHLEAGGQASAVETSRGTCYALTAKGLMTEEAARVPWWKRQLAAALEGALVDVRGRLASALIGFILGALAIGLHHFVK